MSSNQRSTRALGLGLVLSLSACTGDGDGDQAPACVEIDYAGCAPLYPPSWDQVWQQTLAPSCSGGGSACHGSGGELLLTDPATAYTGLTSGAHPQIVPGDPACSPVMIRLESDDPNFRMPPGNTALPAGARCSIATWITNGATPN